MLRSFSNVFEIGGMMSGPIQDQLRQAMTTGGDLGVEFDIQLNNMSPGNADVFLHETGNVVRIDRQSSGGEPAKILWLPWKQGELTSLSEYSISNAAKDTLFFTYYLTGCKVLAIQGGPVWHIDAPVAVSEFWPQITNNEWVEDYWPTNSTQQVAYLHRAGQDSKLWDLSKLIQGAAPSTYGSGNVGQAIVGGVVNSSKELDLYIKTSPWATLKYASQKRLS